MRFVLLVAALLFNSGASAKWVKFSDWSYVDWDSRKAIGFEQVALTTMTTYQEISSAQMFGLSEIEYLAFDCLKSRYKFNGSVWYSGRMAQGRIEKKFGPNPNWGPIPGNYIRLFADACAR
jgi:hypothetical protein